MPDDLFAPLGEGPVPPMATAADVRARGDQRQRRSRTVLAGAAALVLVLAGAVAVSTSGGDGRDQVLPAQPAPSPQGCPDLPVATDPPDVRCDTPPAPAALASSLLTPPDVAAVLGGRWEQRRTEDLPFPVLPAGCEGGVAIGGPSSAPVLGTAGTFLDGPDDTVAGHTLVQYRDEADAVLALGLVIDSVEACNGQLPGWSLAEGPALTMAPDRVYGELVTAEERLPFAVERVGAVLSAVQVRGPELEDLPAIAEVAVRRLAASAPPATPAPQAPAVFDVTAAFLSPEAATAAERPGWAVNQAYRPQPGPLLDPCGDGVVGDQVVASGERSMGSTREAGGSGLLQEVYAYADEQAAAAALEGYADQVRACPVSPVPEVADTITSDVAESGEDRLLIRNRYCNPACTDSYTTYAYVVQAGRGLTVATYQVGEDGDPAEDARALIDPIADSLARAVDAG